MQPHGFSVSSAGDVNADGFDGVIIGARGLGGGAAYVLFGSAARFGNNCRSRRPCRRIRGFTISGNGIFVGTSVSSAGDASTAMGWTTRWSPPIPSCRAPPIWSLGNAGGFADIDLSDLWQR